MIEYGKIIKQSEISVSDGKESEPAIIYHQSIRVDNNLDVSAIFDSIMEEFCAGHVINPGLQVEQYSDTGKIKRVVKCWTEVV